MFKLTNNCIINISNCLSLLFIIFLLNSSDEYTKKSLNNFSILQFIFFLIFTYIFYIKIISYIISYFFGYNDISIINILLYFLQPIYRFNKMT